MKSVIKLTNPQQRVLLLVFLLPLFLASSCKKETPENPNKDVFKCKINGIPWEAQCDGNIVFGCEAVDCWYNDFDTLRVIEISAKNTKIDNGFNLWFRSKKTEDIKYFPSRIDIPIFGYNKGSDNDRNYYLDTLKQFNFNIIKNDTNILGDRKGTITGTFNFKCINTNKDSIIITDGYFNFGYQ